MEHWPQTVWIIGSKGKVIVLTVYVDDLILAGPGSNDEWDSIRNKVDGVRTTVPTPVGRVLGVHHHFTQDGAKVETQIEMVLRSCWFRHMAY